MALLALNCYLLLQPRYWWHLTRVLRASGDARNISAKRDGQVIGVRDVSGQVFAWDIPKWSPLPAPSVRASSDWREQPLAVSADGILAVAVAAGHEDDVIQIWDLTDTTLVRVIQPPEQSRLQSLAYSPWGDLVAVPTWMGNRIRGRLRASWTAGRMSTCRGSMAVVCRSCFGQSSRRAKRTAA
jgi:hypothetical protein